GKNEILVIADSTNVVIESNESNFFIEEIFVPLPDILVEELSWYPPDAKINDQIDIYIKIINDGEKTSREFDVLLYIDGLLKSNYKIYGISALERKEFVFNYLTNGTHKIEVVIDSLNNIVEKNKANNKLLVYFPTGKIEQKKSDIKITSISIMPSSPVEGESTKIIGFFEADERIEGTASFYVDGKLIGKVKEYSKNWWAGEEYSFFSGFHIIKIIVDEENRYAEINETNNELSFRLFIPYPDFTLTDINYTEENLSDGGKTVFFATIKNEGKETLRDIIVGLYIDSLLIRTNTIHGLPENQTTVIGFDWVCDPGEKEIRVLVDYGERIDEISEENNEMRLRIFVKKPDISFESGECRHTGKDGNLANCNVKIKNNGGTTLRSFSIAFSVDSKQLYTSAIDGIIENGSATASFSFYPKPNKHNINVIADYGNIIFEKDEKNNNFIYSNLFTAHPDIFLNGIEERGSIYFVSISNIGATTLRKFHVNFYVDGILFSSKTMDGMFENSSYTLSFPYSAIHGKHRISVKADAYELLDEKDEKNNEILTDEFFIEPPDIATTDIIIPDEIIDGEKEKIFVTIENLGMGNIYAPISVFFYSNGLLIGEKSAKVLIDAPTTIGFSFVGLQSEENHFRAVAKCSSDVNIGNNELRIMGKPILASDFIVSSIMPVQLSDQHAYITIFATIENIGFDTLRVFSVKFYLGELEVGNRLVKGLLGGSSTTLSYTVVNKLYAEPVKVVVDSDSSVFESNEGNNVLIARPSIEYIKGMAELTIGETVILPSSPDIGDEIVAFISVENIGNTTPSTIDITLNFGEEKLRESIYGVYEGKNYVVSFRFFANPGTWNIDCKVDASNVLSEMDEENNIFNTTMDIELCDLAIGKIYNAPEVFWDGDNVESFVLIDNLAPVSIKKTFSLDFYSGGRIKDTKKIDALPAGKSIIESFKWVADAGTNELVFILDSDESISESDEKNNYKMGSYSTERADIIFGSFVEEKSGIFVTIRNGGGNTTRSFFVDLLIDGILVQRKSKEMMNKNETSTFCFPYVEKEREIRIDVDPTNAVHEANEKNNLLIQDYLGNLYIPPYTDAMVSSFEYVQCTKRGKNMFELKVGISNQGDEDITTKFYTEFFVDGVLLDTVSTQPIAKNSTIYFQYPWFDSTDEHIVRVFIDSNYELAEMDEENNEAIIMIKKNQPPIAIAGTNKIVFKDEEFLLIGRGIDYDGRIVLYQWDFESDGIYDYESNESGKVKTIYKKVGIYNATLTIWDDSGAYASDTIVIKVVEKKEFRLISADMTVLIIELFLFSIIIATLIYIIKWRKIFKEE
ncbi:MAG: CARDB domain-containing protein, partial [Candidatus Thermoplasmatota archaeon]